MRLILLSLLILVLVGCANDGSVTPVDMNSLSIGMTKSEVLGLLGLPRTSSANTQREVLTWVFCVSAPCRNFRVTLVDGRVVSFGL